MSDNFLSRWSKRKLEAKEKPAENALQGLQAKADTTELATFEGVSTAEKGAGAEPAVLAKNAAGEPALPELPVPTEADLQNISQGGDVKAFLTDKVSAELKNKAFKALFSRPEFNVMDGLDIYIDDYNTFVPLTQEQIGKMTFSKQLLSRPDLEKLAEDAEKLSALSAASADEKTSNDLETVVDNSESVAELGVNPSDENPVQELSQTLDQPDSQGDSSEENIAARKT